MARKVASPKNTGGGGYNFEDQVTAWWVLNLLAGRSPLEPALGPPLRLRFQSRPDGWLLDDLVADFAPSGGPVRAAISVKSGNVLRASRAPRDFVRDCWELHLNPHKTGFEASRDRLVLITSPLSKSHRDTVDDALQRALAQSPELLETRLREKRWCGQEVRTFITSFECPSDLPGTHPVHGRKVGALLKAVRFQDFDFTRADSSSKVDALRLCREVLEEGESAAALGLWKELLMWVMELRASGGEVTRETLLDRLRVRVRLVAHPDHAPDWARMQKLTHRWSGDTQETIGGVHLHRERAHQQLQDALRAHRVSLLLGDSGCGKSALLKAVMTPGQLPGPVFCLSTEEVARLDERSPAWALSRPLEELVSTQPASWALLALDGVERLSLDPEFQAIARVLRALRLHEERSPWRVLLLCQRAAWERIGEELRSRGVSLSPSNTVSLGRLEAEELRKLAQGAPALEALLSREDLRPLTGNAKVLDLLAQTITVAGLPEEKEWKGESSLIQWYGTRYLRAGGRGLGASHLVEKLARTQAEERRFVTPLSELTAADTPLVDGLVRLGVLLEREGTLRFTHDLHGDYARQQFLLGQFRAGYLEQIGARLTNPLWHRAIRLLALHLLEQPTQQGNHGLEEWRELFQFMESEPRAGSVGMDLLLEALSFTTRPAPFLDELFAPPLSEQKVGLLRRFLVRFFYTATEPDPRLLDDAPTFLRFEVASKRRVPLPGSGPPTLEWLARQWKPFYIHAPDELIQIATAWLVDGVDLRPLDSGLTQSLSELVLSLAEWNHAQRGTPRAGSDSTWLYTLALLAARADRPRGIALVRQLAGRPSPCESQATETSFKSWPDGPRWPPDDAFRGAVLTLPGAVWLSAIDSELTVELSLALLLEHPRAPESRSGTHLIDVPIDADILRPPGVEGPPYFLAPAWWLLQHDPEQGLKFVINLVNFATERWQDGQPKGSARPITLLLQDESRSFVGDENVFGWHRDSARSKILAAALMALENWLYLAAENECLQLDLLEELLRSSDSSAMVGVLMELALRYPELLEGPLEPLVEQPLLYQWTFSRKRLAAAMPLPWSEHPKVHALVSSWRQMPHRSKDLLTAVTKVFARRNWQWPVVDRLLAKWRDTPAPQLSQLLRERLPAWLNAKNWELHQSPEGGTQMEFVPPRETVDREEQLYERSREQVRSLLSRISMCEVATIRSILDGKDSITEGELEERLVTARDSPDSQAVMARCGAATIAIIRFPEYLRSHPEWQQPCRTWLINACAALPSAIFDCDAQFADLFEDWTHFSARAVVSLWSQQPDAFDLRRSLVTLAGARLNDTVAWLFQEAARHRHRMSRDFLRLLHLAVQFSRLRVIAHTMPLTGAWKREVDSVFARLGESFVEGRLPPLPTDWIGLASEVPPGLPSLSKVPLPGFHIHHLLAAWSWLSAEASAPAVADREFLTASVERLQQLMASSRYWDPKGTPERTPDESWTRSQPGTYLPKLSAQFTVHAADRETRRRLWEPWLRLPEHREAWTAAFLEFLYQEGLSDTGEAPFFRAALSEVLDFARSPQASATLLLDHILVLLLGCQDEEALRRYWSDKQESLARELRPRWKQWAGTALSGPTSATAFLSLLQTPAARCLRVEALTWLIQPGPVLPAERLISLLELVWTEHTTELKHHPGARPAFEALLTSLVGIQNGRAIILSQQLAHSPSPGFKPRG